jgi:hypothetical protein
MEWKVTKDGQELHRGSSYMLATRIAWQTAEQIVPEPVGRFDLLGTGDLVISSGQHEIRLGKIDKPDLSSALEQLAASYLSVEEKIAIAYRLGSIR